MKDFLSAMELSLSKSHAVTAVGETSYTYDSNGNMTVRGSQTITWDVENHPVSITEGENTSTFVYDGNGNRVKKTEGGETILYVNRYYEKNLTTSEVTTYYHHGGRLVAMRKGSDLKYIHQDHLTGTSVVSDTSGAQVSAIKYYPFGATRSGSVPTDKQFTGQRLDGTGLYYYNARYYDPQIGRFISADSMVPDSTDPQYLNRYSYVLNNPLRYVDPSGHSGPEGDDLSWEWEEFPPPPEDGALAHTSRHGWLIGSDKQWIPISDILAETLLSDYFSGSFANWSEFISPFVPYLATITPNAPSSIWPPSKTVEIGGKIYFMGPSYKVSRESYTVQLELYQVQEATTGFWIFVCDAITILGDAVSFGVGPAAIVPWAVSGISSIISYDLAVDYYNLTGDELQRLDTDITAGLLPFIGILPGIDQLVSNIEHERERRR